MSWKQTKILIKKYQKKIKEEIKNPDCNVVALAAPINSLMNYHKTAMIMEGKEGEQAIELDLKELKKLAKKSTKPKTPGTKTVVHPAA